MSGPAQVASQSDFIPPVPGPPTVGGAGREQAWQSWWRAVEHMSYLLREEAQEYWRCDAEQRYGCAVSDDDIRARLELGKWAHELAAILPPAVLDTREHLVETRGLCELVLGLAPTQNTNDLVDITTAFARLPARPPDVSPEIRVLLDLLWELNAALRDYQNTDQVLEQQSAINKAVDELLTINNQIGDTLPLGFQHPLRRLVSRYAAVVDRARDDIEARIKAELLIPQVRERDWPQWEAQIADLLNSQVSVGVDNLRNVPEHSVDWALLEFQRRYPDLDLVYKASSRRLYYRHGEQLQRFRETWQRVQDRFTVGCGDKANEDLDELTKLVCTSLGFKWLPDRTREYLDLRVHVVETPPLEIKCSTTLPLVMVPQQADSDRTRSAIAELPDVLDLQYDFGLLFLFGDPGPNRGLPPDYMVMDRISAEAVLKSADRRRAFIRQVATQVELKAIHPYQSEGPVKEDMFFGRQEEIRHIEQRLSRTSIAILAGRQFGKTSLLRAMQRAFAKTGSPYARTVFINLQNVPDYAQLITRLNSDIQAGEIPGEALPEKPQAKPSDWVPYAVEAWIRDLRRREKATKPYLLLVDEVDELLSHDLEQGEPLFRVFRALSEDGHARFIFSGERMLRRAMLDSNTRLYNFCKPIPLGVLDKAAVSELVRRPMELMGISLDPPDQIVERIQLVSGGHPRMVQWICARLVEDIRAHDTRKIDVGDLETVIGQNDFKNELLNTMWAQATSLERILVLLLIRAARPLHQGELRAELESLGISARGSEVEEGLDYLTLISLLERDRNQKYRCRMSEFENIHRERDRLEGDYLDRRIGDEKAEKERREEAARSQPRSV